MTKPTTKPTCRELLDSIRTAFDHEEVVAGHEVDLAARVEKVLALKPDKGGETVGAQGWVLGWNDCLNRVNRLLDGGS